MREDFTLLLDRSFRLLFAARTISLLGSSMAPIALAFAVYTATDNSATALGWALAGRSVGAVAFMLYGGVLADRLNRFKLMVGSDVLAFAAQAGIALLFLTGFVPLWLLVVLNLFGGAAGALFLPASRAVIPQIVAAERLQAANALLRLTRNTTSIVGAALGGALVALTNGGWALAIDAVTFLLSALLLAGVKLVNPARAGGSTILADLRHGWKEFLSYRWIWLIVVQFAFVNFCFAAINVLGPLVAKQQLGGAVAWAAITTAQAVGLVGGSLVAMRLRPRFPMRTAVLATFGFLPPFALLAMGAPVWLIAAAMLLNGVCVDIFEILWDTALQRHVPEGSLSRISAYDATASFALGPLGLILVGPVAAAWGNSATLLAAGLLLTLITLATFVSKSVRQLPVLPSDRPTVT